MRMLVFTAALAAVGLTAAGQAAPTLAHDMEPRIGLRSEPVIRQELKLLGINAQAVQVKGNRARVKVRVDGQPAELVYDRLGGDARVVGNDPKVRNLLERKLKPTGIVVPPKVIQRLDLKVAPRLQRHDGGLRRIPNPKAGQGN